MTCPILPNDVPLHKKEEDDDECKSYSEKLVLEKRPKTYHLTTNELRRKLIDAIEKDGLSVLRVRNGGLKQTIGCKQVQN